MKHPMSNRGLPRLAFLIPLAIGWVSGFLLGVQL